MNMRNLEPQRKSDIMSIRFSLLTIVLFAFCLPAWAQKIVYSEPDDDDYRRTQFEVVGKVSGNFLVYKKQF